MTDTNRLPSVPLMHLNGPATLWWELPQMANDPPHGWLRLSILHVLPDALHAQWQPLDPVIASSSRRLVVHV